MALDQQNDSSKFFLYAVNVMLQMINELPVNDDIELAEVIEAQLASSVLIETKKEVLGDRWNINTEDNYYFPQDPSGYIAVPANVLSCVGDRGDVVMVDWRLYSRKNQTAIFEDPVAVSVVWDRDFNSLPHPIRNYITVRAARKFQARTVMDTSVYSYSQQDEEDAYLAARRDESFTGQFNMLTSSYGVDNLVM